MYTKCLSISSAVCCFKGTWVHPHTIPPTRLLTQIWEFWVTFGVETMPFTSCEAAIIQLKKTASHIHIRYTPYLSLCYAVSRAYGCTLILIPFHQPRFWPQGMVQAWVAQKLVNVTFYEFFDVQFYKY
jgi:hypothetical protein